MKPWLPILLAIVLSACSSTTELTVSPQTEEKPISSPLPIMGVAPELTNEVWLNTDQQLRLAGLHGQVVLLEMWTFG